jgi:hypothetical protein
MAIIPRNKKMFSELVGGKHVIAFQKCELRHVRGWRLGIIFIPHTMLLQRGTNTRKGS